MLGNKEFESSDSDDSDFVIDSHQDSSDDSLQSECESDTTDNTHENHHKKRKKNTNNKKKQVTKNKKKKSLPDEDTTNDEDINSSKNILSPNEEKARADSLWETFLSDTATSSKSRLSNTTTNLSANTTDSSDLNKDTSEKQSNDLHTKNLNKVDNKKFTDAKEVIKNNRNLLNKTKDKSATSSQLFVPENDLKKNNISSILQSMQKKQKLTTLEKSKLDWKQFKEEHNLQEEISRHNRGKSGYLEKQDFLQRADLRQFEIEKELRNVGKRKTR